MSTSQRVKFLLFLFKFSQSIYRRVFKWHKDPWNSTEEQLLKLPEHSLGKALGLFYQQHNIKSMPKFENHDVYHILTGIGLKMHDEIALQYLLIGNGKVSLYLLGTIFLGTAILPEHHAYYRAAFLKGRRMPSFHHLNFKPLLGGDLHQCMQISTEPHQVKHNHFCTPSHKREHSRLML